MDNIVARRAAALCLLLGVFSPLAAARLARPQSGQVIIGQIATEGASRFSTAQIAAASGLKVGQPSDNAALDAAANRLSQTGAFSEVRYRYQTVAGKLAVTFQVTEEPKSMACVFDNFIWFAPEDIERTLSAEVPLYDGRVPVDGTLSQAVATSLEHMLSEHHITATVAFIPAGDLGKPPTRFLYSAKGNLPLISSVEYTGGPLDASNFSIATQRLVGRPFSTAYSQSLVTNDLDVIYHNHGYLRAHFSDVKPALAAGATAEDPGSVELTFSVTPGTQYTWSGSDWSGDQTYSAAELDKLLSMKSGGIAAADKISAGVDAVRDTYGKKGYITVNLSPQQIFDDAAHSVRYSFKVDEGSQYHMGMFTVSNVDDKIADQIRKAWRLKSGDVYDASYMKDFVAKDLSRALAGTPFAKAPISFAVHPNASAQAVDVSLSIN